MSSHTEATQPKPTAEVVSIGDEMTTGARVDTNTAWLSQELGRLGLRVAFHTTVGDDLQEGGAAISAAAERADFIVITGGLGPTRDDLTREVLAEVAGVPLEFHAAVMRHIETLFANRGREMPERNRIQAMFPAGCQTIPNPQGTAPGIDIALGSETSRCRAFALPGVPAEMKQMFRSTVAPRLLEAIGAGGRVIRQHVVKCFGCGESEMESRLGELTARGRVPAVGITVSRATISLRMTTDAADATEAERQIAVTRQAIYDAVPEFIFGEGESYQLQHAVCDRLRAQGQRLVTFEQGASCPLAGWLAEAREADEYRGGIHAFDWAFLSRDPWPHDAEPSRKKEVLKELADRAAADLVLAVDAYPKLPADDTPVRAVPVQFLLWDRRDGDSLPTETQTLGGHPDIIPHRIAKAALDWLRKRLG